MGLGFPLVAVSNILIGVSQSLQVFRLVKVSHVKRQCNKSAHILASYAKEVLNSDNLSKGISNADYVGFSLRCIEFIFFLIKLQSSHKKN